jgi:methyl-accepting chemotaxis protein
MTLGISTVLESTLAQSPKHAVTETLWGRKMSRQSRRMKEQGSDEGSALSAIVVVLELMSAQLQDIESDIGASVEGVCSGFSGMGERAKAALASASDALDSSVDGGGLQAFVFRVKIALETLLNRIDSDRNCDGRLAIDLRDTRERLNLVHRLSKKIIEIGCRATDAIPQESADEMDDEELETAYYQLKDHVSVLAYAAKEAGKAICDIHAGIQKSLAGTCELLEQKVQDDDDVAKTTETRIRELLDKLTGTYERMSKSLSSSATMSWQLNIDINQAIVNMQFHDRVSQRLAHLTQSIEELMNDIRPYTKSADGGVSQSITNYWLSRIQQKSTMASERQLTVEVESATDNVELF